MLHSFKVHKLADLADIFLIWHGAKNKYLAVDYFSIGRGLGNCKAKCSQSFIKLIEILSCQVKTN